MLTLKNIPVSFDGCGFGDNEVVDELVGSASVVVGWWLMVGRGRSSIKTKVRI